VPSGVVEIRAQVERGDELVAQRWVVPVHEDDLVAIRMRSPLFSKKRVTRRAVRSLPSSRTIMANATPVMSMALRRVLYPADGVPKIGPRK
jgi:hypothetical protein